MAYIGQRALIWSVSAAVLAAYLQYTGYRPLKSSSSVQAELGAYDNIAKTPDTFILFTGRLVFVIVTLAWAVEIFQALKSAVRRYLHKPTVTTPLQPLQQRPDRQQQTVQHVAASKTSQKSHTPPDQQHRTECSKASTRTPHGSDTQREAELEERRRRAAEARQRELDAATAVLREQQRQQELQQLARAEAAAAHAAEQRRLRESMQQAARIATEHSWQNWEQAMVRQFSRPPDTAQPPVPVTVTGQGIVTTLTRTPAQAAAPATAAATVAEDRELRHQQDQEYQASLAADKRQALRKRQQQLLESLKVVLQQVVPNSATAADLTVRVKLPDGSTSVRQFAAQQSLSDIYDWVFSLPAMTCLAPGCWYLTTTFPKQRLAAPTGIWALGGCSAECSELEQYIQQKLKECGGGPAADVQVPDGWTLAVRQLNGEELKLTVNDGWTVLDVKQQLTLLTGLPCAAQRLIFAGHVLLDSPTLKQLGVTKQHTLQMAPKVPAAQVAGAGQAQSSSSSNAPAGSQDTGKGDQVDADSALEVDEADANNMAGDSDVLVVADVRQLREQVALGASQLALYVMITQHEL